MATVNQDRVIHVAAVGAGLRGKWNIPLVAQFDKVHVDYICDLYQDKAELCADKIQEKQGYRPTVTTDYRELLNDPAVEAIFVFSNWEPHIPMAIAAMKAGKWVGMEVGGAYSLEACWDLVHTSEQTGMPCMLLENCCFGRDELRVANMVRRGLFGRVVHCEGGYRHDLRDEIADGEKLRHYRLHNYLNDNCHNYPTHDFGPIAKILGINRGNRMTSLVSVASGAFGVKDFVTRHRPENEALQGVDFAQGDVVTTIITCAHGETVTLTLDTCLPRFYSRDFTVQGTKGMYSEESDTFYFEDCGLSHGCLLKNMESNAKKYDAYLSPMWQPQNADKVIGGHGGMDGLCMDCFFKHLREGNKELPIDVYDAAAWMCIAALSRDSIAMGGAPVAVPDFTNGAWMTRAPLDCDDFTAPLLEVPAEG